MYSPYSHPQFYPPWLTSYAGCRPSPWFASFNGVGGGTLRTAPGGGASSSAAAAAAAAEVPPAAETTPAVVMGGGPYPPCEVSPFPPYPVVAKINPYPNHHHACPTSYPYNGPPSGFGGSGGTRRSAEQEFHKFGDAFNSSPATKYSDNNYTSKGKTGEDFPATSARAPTENMNIFSSMTKKVPAVAVLARRIDGLEGLEQEVKKHQEARDLRKRNAAASSSSSTSSAKEEEEDVEEAEIKLALKLLEYERMGYLTKIDNEEDDFRLIYFGDEFGLAVLNEYPNFFFRVPQYPHYRAGASLGEVDKDYAEAAWDLFMPLMKRGLSAVRDNKKKEISAVESMIARLAEDGFNLKHLQAYINASRRARANHASLREELKKLESEIEVEKKKIDGIISSRPIEEVIGELEEDRAKYERLIEDIESSLAEKLALLEVEKAVRASSSTPAHEQLLKTRDLLERKMEVSNATIVDLLL